MTKIVYNACFGGFSLSKAGVERYMQLSGKTGDLWEGRDIPRNDPHLAQVVEELGARASGGAANLRIKEIAAGTKYRIDEYDGAESVETPDSYEWSIA